MRVTTICAAAAVMFALVGARVLAQELIPVPDPIGGTPIAPGADIHAGAPAHSNPASDATAAPAADQWRYRWFDGHWWYWTPQNRWLWYSNDGQWVEFNANHSPSTADRSGDNPAPYDGTDHSAGQGNRSGNYPGVAVGARPCENASVSVGQRIGVDVAGNHGVVGVGRICVGW
jgi:hypothetical protein